MHEQTLEIPDCQCLTTCPCTPGLRRCVAAARRRPRARCLSKWHPVRPEITAAPPIYLSSSPFTSSEVLLLLLLTNLGTPLRYIRSLPTTRARRGHPAPRCSRRRLRADRPWAPRLPPRPAAPSARRCSRLFKTPVDRDPLCAEPFCAFSSSHRPGRTPRLALGDSGSVSLADPGEDSLAARPRGNPSMPHSLPHRWVLSQVTVHVTIRATVHGLSC